MVFDNYGYIVMEQSGLPGGYGDSCAETSRYVTLKAVIGDQVVINLVSFVTDQGVLRHPLSPWREDDTSLDQMYPLLAATTLTNKELRNKVDGFITDYSGKTYNGKIVNFGMQAQVARSRDEKHLWINDLSILGQALIFKLPYRWSDSKKWFEKNDSTSDYLNFVNGIAFAKVKNNETWPIKLAKKLIKKETVLEKVKSYYQPEPNSQWLVDLYSKALEVIYV